MPRIRFQRTLLGLVLPLLTQAQGHDGGNAVNGAPNVGAPRSYLRLPPTKDLCARRSHKPSDLKRDEEMLQRDPADSEVRAWFAARLQSPSALTGEGHGPRRAIASVLIKDPLLSPGDRLRLYMSLSIASPEAALASLGELNFSDSTLEKLNECWSKDDLKALARSLEKVATLAVDSPATRPLLEKLRPALLTLKYNNPDAFDAFLHDLSSAVRARLIAKYPELLESSSSRIFYYAQAGLQRLIGLSEYRPRTDIEWKPGEDNAPVRVYSSQGAQVRAEVSGAVKASPAATQKNYDGLFSIARLTLPYPPDEAGANAQTHAEVSWDHLGQTARATWDINRDAEKHFSLQPIDAPKDEDRWADGELNGVVLVGENLEPEPRKLLNDEYLEYYGDQGYEIDETRDKIDTLPLLADLISSGKADYFIKEAHSLGSDLYLVQVTAKSKVVSLSKVREDGRTERVTLINPIGTRPVVVSYDAIAGWMKKRAQTAPHEMVYVNASCSSNYQGRSEIFHIRSPHFTDITTETTATMFYNAPVYSVGYQVVDGVRLGQSYSKIRQRMDKARTARRGLTNLSSLDSFQNVYLLPDQPEYVKLIPKANLDVKFKWERQQADGRWIPGDDTP